MVPALSAGSRRLIIMDDDRLRAVRITADQAAGTILPSELTVRECEVLGLVARGMSNADTGRPRLRCGQVRAAAAGAGSCRQDATGQGRVAV